MVSYSSCTSLGLHIYYQIDNRETCESVEPTDAGLLGGSGLEALAALAVVGTRLVDTVTVGTGVAQTLVHI